MCLSLYTVSQKLGENESILISFGVPNPKEILHQEIIYSLISPD